MTAYASAAEIAQAIASGSTETGARAATDAKDMIDEDLAGAH